MDRSKSLQNRRKCSSRIARYKSLGSSGESTIKSTDYDAGLKRIDPACTKQMQLMTKCGRCIENKSLETTSITAHNFSSSNESTDKLEDFDFLPKMGILEGCKGLKKIFPHQFLRCGENLRDMHAEMLSSDEDRNIVEMPIEVSRYRDTDSGVNPFIYGQDRKEEVREAEKNLKIPLRSNKNYIFSRQTRLPQETTKGRPTSATTTFGIAAGSISEVTDNNKFISITTFSVLAFVLALTCIGWHFTSFKTPRSSGLKKTSLLKYFIEKTYQALLQIYY